MIKIFLSVRNRLAITKKCIEAIVLHSEVPHRIYVYDNDTNYKLKEHFDFFYKLIENKIISQISFTTKQSTFNAFSKASSCNFFGHQHEEDPKKDKYDFLMFLDNDIIVTPGWDTKLNTAWKFVNRGKLDHIKVIGQLPGGIKNIKEKFQIEKMIAKAGSLGGSGLWSVRPNFFRDVGFLDLKELVGLDKRHDQLYWRALSSASNGRPYIMGLSEKLGIHCGRYAGSVCNRLTRNKSNPRREELIKFENAEKEIDSQDFKSFYMKIVNNKKLLNDW